MCVQLPPSCCPVLYPAHGVRKVLLQCALAPKLSHCSGCVFHRPPLFFYFSFRPPPSPQHFFLSGNVVRFNASGTCYDPRASCKEVLFVDWFPNRVYDLYVTAGCTDGGSAERWGRQKRERAREPVRLSRLSVPVRYLVVLCPCGRRWQQRTAPEGRWDVRTEPRCPLASRASTFYLFPLHFPAPPSSGICLGQRGVLPTTFRPLFEMTGGLLCFCCRQRRPLNPFACRPATQTGTLLACP